MTTCARRTLAARRASRSSRAKAHDKALEEFTAAYALAPSPHSTHIAASYDGLKDRTERARYLQRYLEADPTGPRATVTAKRIVVLTKELQKTSRAPSGSLDEGRNTELRIVMPPLITGIPVH